MTNPTNHARIRQVLQDWAEATRSDRKDEILAGHDVGAVIFDVLPPDQYRGVEAYRKSWEQWQPPFEIPSIFEIHDLHITADDRTAFAYCMIKCGGKLPSGELIEDWVRATFCLVQNNGDWRILHQHLSMPMRSRSD